MPYFKSRYSWLEYCKEQGYVTVIYEGYIFAHSGPMGTVKGVFDGRTGRGYIDLDDDKGQPSDEDKK